MKNLVTFITAWVLCMSIYAQGQGGARHHTETPDGNRKEFSPEQYKKHMEDFVTREAKLTEAESAKFFPILHEMRGKQFNLMKQQRELMRQGRQNTSLSELEYEKIITQTTALDIESKEIEQTYFKKFHAVLPWKKIFAVRQALNRYQMEALKQFRPGPREGTQKNPSKGNGLQNNRK